MAGRGLKNTVFLFCFVKLKHLEKRQPNHYFNQKKSFYTCRSSIISIKGYEKEGKKGKVFSCSHCGCRHWRCFRRNTSMRFLPFKTQDIQPWEHEVQENRVLISTSLEVTCLFCIRLYGCMGGRLEMLLVAQRTMNEHIISCLSWRTFWGWGC